MPLLHKGDVIGSEPRYIVQRKLGEGQFAEVWEVKLADSNASRLDLRYALKLEKRKDRNTVKQEYKALKKLSGTCSQVVAVENCGVYDERFYMVLQLLGETLYDARKQTGGRFDQPTLKAVGLSTLAAIEQVHQQHMIHRDIKPANFVIDPPNAAACKGSWLLIDFGLARRYTDDSGTHLPPRTDASFRGSTTYASVHAHKDEDLSRRDDLWSWLYMLAELLDGGLPWRQDKEGGEQHVQIDKHWVQQQKEACIQQPSLLTRSVQLPEPLAAISGHLNSLGFEDTPDYDHLRHCLQQLPDREVQLHSLIQPGQLLPNGQQWQDAAFARQIEADQHQQQQVVQPPWAAAPNGLQQQQQQQQEMLTPASPPQEHASPAEVSAAAAAAGAKRPRPSTADSEQLAKKRRSDSSQPCKSNLGTQQQQQQQSQRPGSGVLRSPAGDASADDSRPSSRQGSGAVRVPRPADVAAAAKQASRQCSRRSRSRSRSKERQQDWSHSRERGREREREPQDGGKARHSTNGTREQDRKAAGAGQGDRDREGQAAGPDSSLGQAAKQQRQVAGRAASSSSSSGSAAEITDLIAAFHNSDAVQQVAQGLCALQPAEAVCAIGITLDKLVHQANLACMPAVAQILQDLAAFASSGAAKALRRS